MCAMIKPEYPAPIVITRIFRAAKASWGFSGMVYCPVEDVPFVAFNLTPLNLFSPFSLTVTISTPLDFLVTGGLGSKTTFAPWLTVMLDASVKR